MRTPKSGFSLLLVAVVLYGVLLPARLTATAAAPLQGNLIIWTEDNSLEPLGHIVEEFERDTGTGVTVEVWTQEEIRNWFLETDDPSTGPDIFWLSDDLLIQLEHILAPVELGDRALEFSPYAMRASTLNDQLLMLPVVLKTLALYRNTDLVPDAPKTWDELAAQAAEVRESGAAAHGLVYWNEGGYHALQMLASFGGYLFAPNDDGTYDTGNIALNNDVAIDFFATLQTIVQPEALDPEINWDMAHELFASGNAAMIISGPWVLGWFKDAGIPFAVSPLPTGAREPHIYVHVSGFGVNAHGHNQDAALLFLNEYVAPEKSIAQLAAFTGLVPAHLTALEKLDDPTALSLLQAITNPQLWPIRTPQLDVTWGPLGEAIHAILFQGADVKDTLDNTTAQIAAALDDR